MLDLASPPGSQGRAGWTTAHPERDLKARMLQRLQPPSARHLCSLSLACHPFLLTQHLQSHLSRPLHHEAFRGFWGASPQPCSPVHCGPPCGGHTICPVWAGSHLHLLPWAKPQGLVIWKITGPTSGPRCLRQTAGPWPALSDFCP